VQEERRLVVDCSERWIKPRLVLTDEAVSTFWG